MNTLHSFLSFQFHFQAYLQYERRLCYQYTPDQKSLYIINKDRDVYIIFLINMDIICNSIFCEMNTKSINNTMCYKVDPHCVDKVDSRNSSEHFSIKYSRGLVIYFQCCTNVENIVTSGLSLS